MIEARFPDPLPVDDRVAREWGYLQSVMVAGGGQPRRRVVDLAVAATARVHDAVLVTANAKDFLAISHLLQITCPAG